MSYTTLISVNNLKQNLNKPNWVIVDCRFSLADTQAGRQDYQQAHIPGAIYAHLDEDLSGPIVPNQTGRHPLPTVDKITQTLSQWGIDDTVQVIAYDQQNGAIAARLWWMLQWLGHKAIAVLDGGWAAWESQKLPTQAGIETQSSRIFKPKPKPHLLATTEDVIKMLQQSPIPLFDSRNKERYQGDVEPIDAIGGHIPGAILAPFANNLNSDGFFLPKKQLKTRFQTLLKEWSPAESVFYCGSGVTAAHNLLALAHIGLGDARLYVGSWSEWITQSDRPIATGSS